jgi:putative transposase
MVTKYRRKILTRGVSQYAKVLFQDIEQFRPGVEFIEIGMDGDHVHCYLIIPPKYSVSQIVNAIKVNSSKKLKSKFSFLGKVYWGTESIWSTGFFVSTVGIDDEVIRNYVRMQGKEDFGQTQFEL